MLVVRILDTFSEKGYKSPYPQTGYRRAVMSLGMVHEMG